MAPLAPAWLPCRWVILPVTGRLGRGWKKQELQASDYELSNITCGKACWEGGFQGYFRPTKVAINLQRKLLGIKKPSGQSLDPGTHITLFSRLKTIVAVKRAAPPGLALTGSRRQGGAGEGGSQLWRGRRVWRERGRRN